MSVSRWWDRFHHGALRVTFFDVGQGDSVLVRFPQGSVWVVDGGGGSKQWDRGQRDLFLELARMGVLTIDVALLSHPDADHGKGLRGLMRNLTVREWWWNAVFARGDYPLIQELEQVARERGTVSRPFSSARHWMLEGVSATLVPLRASTSKNENPLSLWLEYGGCRVLLAGDAEKRGEDRLVAWDSRPVHILKVNHHGSKTSSTEPFVEALRPHWAVVSVGARNSYGHPSGAVLRRWKNQGARVLRTDQHGYAEFVLEADGSVRCTSADGPCGTSRCTKSW